MKSKFDFQTFLLRLLSYVLVAAVSVLATLLLCRGTGVPGTSKLDQLENLILERFVDELDKTAIEDAAAAAMVSALGDRWSYYVPSSQYGALQEQKENAYVGIGITITARADGAGFDIIRVEPGGSAVEAGILPGDILTHIEGQAVAPLGTDGARALISGKADTQVSVTVLREGASLDFTLTRKQIQTVVARGEMLPGDIGLVTIKNFNDRCRDEAVAAIEELLDRGAQALIFDVRNNGGGYKDEMVALLDYLLPEGPLFRSVDYTGKEAVDSSDEKCLELPMAVLVNGGSYSAAELFAAALSEYGWATVVGEQTSGKGHYQNTFRLKDGSAVGLSVGRYCTPNGVDLEGMGITPDVVVEVDAQTAAGIYAGTLEPEADPQLQAAVKVLANP